MSEQSLEELKKLSLPALQHAELVSLAKTESPNKAYELASIRWPRRQAKATRSLAIVRRDYGLEALEAFLMEHARPNGSEHVQKGDVVMITLDSLYPDGVRNVVFKPHAHTLDQLTIWLLADGGKVKKELVFQEEVKRLNLDVKQVPILVRRIVDAMFAQWATPKVKQFSYGGIWSSAMFAVRTYLSDDIGYYKKALTATVVYHGGCSKDPVGLATAIIPQEDLAKIEKTDEDKNQLSGLMPVKALQPVLDHMLAYFTEEEIGDLWQEMLKTRLRENFITACIVEWWKDLKVGEHDFKKKAEPIARQLLLKELKDILVNGCFDWNNPTYTKNAKARENFMKIVDFLLFQTDYDWRAHNEEVRELVEDYFTTCIARGKVGTAFYMLVRYGNWFNLWSEYASEEKGKPNAAMERLMRAAIEKARKLRNYGIAAAIANHIGDSASATTDSELARNLDQRIAFDFAFYHTVDRN